MPRQRITKEMIVEAAFSLAREGGMEKVLVKNIAERIGCSVQPVYCYCQNMEGLKAEVIDYTRKFIQDYISGQVDTACLFESVGRAHAQLAREEPYLYRLYYLRKRRHAHSLDDIYREETNPETLRDLMEKLEIGEERARRLRRHMMVYNIGLSFILSSLGAETDAEQMREMEHEAYKAFEREILGEEE